MDEAPHPRHPGTLRYLPVLAMAAAVLVSLVDAATGAATLVGLIACIPVLASSYSDDRRAVLFGGGAALVGFGLATASGYPAGSSLPFAQRAIVLVCLLSAGTLALLLQRRRIAALTLRDRAVSASELNRLLMSLLAHDLRAPLSLADQGFHYVEESVGGGYPIDRMLIADVRARLQRSLRAIEMVLSLGRDERAAQADPRTMLRSVSLRHEIAEEVGSFAYEARARGKSLELEVRTSEADRHVVNVPVLRQALAIPLDNAVRYAVPGRIRVTAEVSGASLELRVEDGGPGLSAHRRGATSSGSGLGLRLCGTLLTRAGGALRIERDAEDGSSLLITLPVEPEPAAEPHTPPIVQPAFST